MPLVSFEFQLCCSYCCCSPLFTFSFAVLRWEFWRAWLCQQTLHLFYEAQGTNESMVYFLWITRKFILKRWTVSQSRLHLSLNYCGILPPGFWGHWYWQERIQASFGEGSQETSFPTHRDWCSSELSQPWFKFQLETQLGDYMLN